MRPLTFPFISSSYSVSKWICHYCLDNKWIKQENCLRFGHNLRRMAKQVGILRGITLNRTSKTTESGSTQQYQQKCCKHVRLLKLGLLVTDCLLIIKEDVQSVCLDSSCRHRRNQTFGTILFPPQLNGALYHDLLRKVLIELLQDGDLQTMIHLWFF